MSPNILIALVLALPGFGGASTRPKAPPDVFLLLADRTRAPGPVVSEALHLVAQTFAGLGIRVAWRAGELKSVRPAESVFPIQVRLENSTGDDGDFVVAYCVPFAADAGSIAIYYDRVRRLVHGRRELEPRLLAHVLAHELAHVLEATDEHARTGIMRARWTAAELEAMRQEQLQFTPADSEKIRRGLARRQQGRAALPPPAPVPDNQK